MSEAQPPAGPEEPTAPSQVDDSSEAPASQGPSPSTNQPWYGLAQAQAFQPQAAGAALANRPSRPTSVTLAAIYLIVLGALFALAGAACGLAGGSISRLVGSDYGYIEPGMVDFVGGALVAVGIIGLALGVGAVVGGAGALGGKAWGRWTSVVVAILFVLLFGLVTLGSLEEPDLATLVIFAALTAGAVLSVWAMAAASAYFNYRA